MMIKGYLRLAVLSIIDSSASTGYKLIKDIEGMTGKKPSAGSIYPILNDLCSNGLISVKKIGRKKEYSITKKGKDELEFVIEYKREIASRLSSFSNLFKSGKNEEPDVSRFHSEVMSIKEILARIAMNENKSKAQKARQVMDYALAKLRDIAR